MANQESGVPGGWGAVARRGGGGRVVEPVVAPTYGTSGGYYTDASGKQISQAEAQASGRVDQPGAVAEKIRSIGGGATTTQIEQRMGIEEARKRGEITRQEAITLTQQNLEGRPLQLIRQATQQEQQRRADVAALQEFRERTGALSPVGRGYREATQREAKQLAPERVFVKLNGRNVPFVSREKAEQTRPMTQLQRKAEQSIYDKNVELSNILKYDVPGKVPKPITNFFDAIDKRAKLSFQLEKPPGALKIHYLAENIYDVVKGMKKGVVEQPLTTGASLVLGGALAKGAGVLAARAPILTRGVSAGRVGSKISALNVAGGAMAGYYGADVAKRIAAADNRNQEIGKILSTEIIPFAAGAKIAGVTTKDITAAAREARIAGYQVRGTAKDAGVYLRKAIQTQRKGMKEFIKNERAAMQMQLTRQGITPRMYISAELVSPAQSSYVSRVYSVSEIVGLRAADIGRTFALSETTMISTLKTKIKNLEAKINDPNRPRQSKKNIEFEQKILAQWKKELQTKTGSIASAKPADVTIKVGKVSQKQIAASARTVVTAKQEQKSASRQFQASISAQIEKTNLQMSGVGLKQVKKPAIKTPSDFVKGAVARQKTLQKISRGALLGIMAGVGQAQRVSKAISPAQQYAGALKSIQAQHSGNLQAIKSIQGLAHGQAIGQVTPQIPVQKQAQLLRQRQEQRQVQKIRTEVRAKPSRKPPEKKKVILKPPTFDSQLEDLVKARKKRGKFVWNIRNQIPTLESLIG